MDKHSRLERNSQLHTVHVGDRTSITTDPSRDYSGASTGLVVSASHILEDAFFEDWVLYYGFVSTATFKG